VDAQGRRKEALDAYRRHLSDLETLARRAPEDAGLAVSLSKAHGLLGTALVRQNDLEGALAHQRESERIAQRAVRPGADPVDARDAWLAATTRVGQAHVFRGEFAEALATQGHALERAEALSRAEPGDDRWRRRSVEARLGSISPLAKTGDVAAAQRTYDEVRAALERERAADPGNERWSELLAILEARLADALIPLRRYEEALVHTQAGLAIAEPLAARDETNAKRIHLVVDLADRASAALWSLHRREEAVAERRKTVAASERLLARDPSNPTWRQMLGFNVRRLSEVERGMGRDRASLEAAERARGILEPLAREFPDDAAVVVDTAFVGWEIVLARYRLGEREAARSALGTARERVHAVSSRWLPSDYGGVLLATARTLDPRDAGDRAEALRRLDELDALLNAGEFGPPDEPRSRDLGGRGRALRAEIEAVSTGTPPGR
jgi:tetratricopeptide (TPR) repeat protein